MCVCLFLHVALLQTSPAKAQKKWRASRARRRIVLYGRNQPRSTDRRTFAWRIRCLTNKIGSCKTRPSGHHQLLQTLAQRPKRLLQQRADERDALVPPQVRSRPKTVRVSRFSARPAESQVVEAQEHGEARNEDHDHSHKVPHEPMVAPNVSWQHLTARQSLLHMMIMLRLFPCLQCLCLPPKEEALFSQQLSTTDTSRI